LQDCRQGRPVSTLSHSKPGYKVRKDVRSKLKIAVFIDFGNVEIGVKTTLNLQFDIGAVLEAIKNGEVITKVAWNWKRSGEHDAPWPSTPFAWCSA
jgi:hypothetical protein